MPDERVAERLLKRGKNGDRVVYDTRRTGQSNTGHNFGVSLNEMEKADLIEYLKRFEPRSAAKIFLVDQVANSLAWRHAGDGNPG